MFKQPCLSVESQKEQMTYRVSINRTVCALRIPIQKKNWLTRCDDKLFMIYN